MREIVKSDMKYFVLYMVECANNKITQIGNENPMYSSMDLDPELKWKHYNFKVMSLKQDKLRLSGLCGLPTAPGHAPDEVVNGLLRELLSDLD